MKTNIFLILSALFLSACSPTIQGKDLVGESFIHNDLNPYVEAYKASAKISKVNLQMPAYLYVNFSDETLADKTSVVGLCELKRSSSGTVVARVSILKSYWNRVSEVNKRILIFHELTHCIRFRGHVSTEMTLDNGRTVPASLMNVYTVGSYFYGSGMAQKLLDLMPYYENELFHPVDDVSKLIAKSSKTVRDENNNEHQHDSFTFATHADHSCSH